MNLARFLLLLVSPLALAQGPPQPKGPENPKAAAQIDITGQWVAVVSEDWVYRMVVAPKGDAGSIPINDAGKKAAQEWDPVKEANSCKAYGAVGIIRMPSRVRISWQDDRTMKMEFDAGTQTRLLHFGAGRPPGAPSLQGDSAADWQRMLPPNNPFGINFPGGPPPPPGGSLRVVTTNLSGGWLRRNGVPYSAKTTVTEFFDRFPVPDGSEWFVVTTQVVDPEYLLGRLVTSSHFRRESDASKWSPKPCKPV
jgi:hypothetical protein